MHITVNNDYSFLQSSDEALKDKIFKIFRFRKRNYWHSRLYKSKLWDGYTNFFEIKTGKFLTGILPEIELVLKHLNQEYEIVDLREDLKFDHEEINHTFLNQWLPEGMSPVTLMDYQVEFINHVIKYKRGIIKSPTGSGKTFVLLGAMKALPPGTPILFLANRKTLVNQNYEEMVNWGFENVGILHGTKKKPNTITCATVQSLKHIEDQLTNFKALFVDEIHMMTSSQAIRAYKKLKGCRVRVGLSATPFKFGEKDKVQKYTCRGFFGPVFKTKTSESGVLATNILQKRGRLSKSRCFFYPIEQPELPYHLYLDAVTDGIAESWHFHKIIKRLTDALQGRTLILVERIAHGDMLNSLIPGSLWVRGEDNDETRKYVIEKLKVSKDKVVAIATQGIFNVGVNVFVNQLINAAGGKAEHDIIQRMGRGLRTAEDKDILNYYDFIFKINPYLYKHSLQRIKILEKENHEVIIKEAIDF